MINLIVIPETNIEDFPSRLIFPFNNEDDIRLAMEALLDISNAGVTFKTKIEENIMDEECQL